MQKLKVIFLTSRKPKRRWTFSEVHCTSYVFSNPPPRDPGKRNLYFVCNAGTLLQHYQHCNSILTDAEIHSGLDHRKKHAGYKDGFWTAQAPQRSACYRNSLVTFERLQNQKTDTEHYFKVFFSVHLFVMLMTNSNECTPVILYHFYKAPTCFNL
jgi:hypothetical protein